jgi:hypothetical protein
MGLPPVFAKCSLTGFRLSRHDLSGLTSPAKGWIAGDEEICQHLCTATLTRVWGAQVAKAIHSFIHADEQYRVSTRISLRVLWQESSGPMDAQGPADLRRSEVTGQPAGVNSFSNSANRFSMHDNLGCEWS